MYVITYVSPTYVRIVFCVYTVSTTYCTGWCMYMCTGVQYGILKGSCTVPYRCIHIVHVCNVVTNVACMYMHVPHY